MMGDGSETGAGGAGASRLRGHLRLLRLPLIGTTVADVWAGYFGARALLALGPAATEAGGASAAPAAPVALAELALLHLAAACLYGAGMTLNDVFDARRDRALHPERPIPSGAVSARAAAAQGGALLAAGVGLAGLAGPAHGALAGLLAIAILLYDGLLKRWPIPGGLAMGLVRYLDVQIGVGIAIGGAFAWGFQPAVFLGLYVFVLTYLSTFEERAAAAPGALRPTLVLMCLVLAVAGYAFPYNLVSVWFYASVAAAAMFFGMSAWRGRSRAGYQRLTLVLLLGIFVVDGGSLAGLGRWDLGLATAALAGSFFVLRMALAPRGGPQAAAPRAPNAAARPHPGDPA